MIGAEHLVGPMLSIAGLVGALWAIGITIKVQLPHIRELAARPPEFEIQEYRVTYFTSKES